MKEIVGFEKVSSAFIVEINKCRKVYWGETKLRSLKMGGQQNPLGHRLIAGIKNNLWRRRRR